MSDACSPSYQLHRSGFTLMEMLVVVAAVSVLLGIGIPAWTAVLKSQRSKSAQALVEQVAVVIANHPTTTWPLATVDAAGKPATRQVPLWDWDRDQILDGDPTQSVGGNAALAAELVAAGYTGFVDTLHFPARATALDATTRVLRDPWKHPLRMSWAAGVYGQAGFGVWSLGPDGVDGPLGSPAAADNLCSWKPR